MIAADRDGRRKASLLVSVRSREEAESALSGGADILDVKNPARGSLGYAGWDVLDAIARTAVRDGRQPVLTAAAGEVREWEGGEIPSIPSDYRLCKFGLSGLRDAVRWPERWNNLRSAVDANRGDAIGWVGVAYADAEAAGAPPLEAVVEASIQTNCCGLLIDTYGKQNGRLLDFVDPTMIEAMAEQLHAAGLFLAVAGRLRIEEIARLGATSADIVAVRSAACVGGDRGSEVVEEQVRECVRAIGGAVAFRKHSTSRMKKPPAYSPGANG